MDSVESYYLETLQNTLLLSEELKECEDKSPNKPPFAINYLEYYDSRETVISWIIRHIFAYTYRGRHLFFESFAETFLQGIGFKMEWIDAPFIDKDHEYKGIDILVRDIKYAIIIENKLKGAQFQLNQLARYIATMRDEGYSDEQIFVIVLPKDVLCEDDICGSVWNLPKDWKSTNFSRKCRIDDHTCWCDYDDFKPKAHCKKCGDLKEPFKERTLFIQKDFSDWLYRCVVNNTVNIPEEERSKQYVLTSATLQFVDYLNYLYQTRENNYFKMDIQNFLSEKLKLNNLEITEQLLIIEERKNGVEELAEKLEELYRSKIQEYIDHIGTKVKLVFDKNDDSYFSYFHCELNYENTLLVLRIQFDDDEKKKNYCQLETKPKNKKIPEEIVKDSAIYKELNDKNNKKNEIWSYDDSYEESLKRFDRVLGRLLEIINQK